MTYHPRIPYSQNGFEAPLEIAKFSSEHDEKLLADDSVHITSTIVPEKPAGLLIITSYPPRECGIATYSQDLIEALYNKFSQSLQIKVCAMESGEDVFSYSREVKYVLKTFLPDGYAKLANAINLDPDIQFVLIQHEFGFFKKQQQAFTDFLHQLTKPVIIVFHTVLPRPNPALRLAVKQIADACVSVIVMTHNSKGILTQDYDVPDDQISVIAHGTHLVSFVSNSTLKKKYALEKRKVFTTFGLLSRGKSIETTIEALPVIVSRFPDALFLVIGKTHPEVFKNDGEEYRESLEKKVKALGLENHVKFINQYLPLPELLEYLQLTDIYLFTTNDPNQAVSGTFAYAMSCGCPVISTPIPHAREVLTHDTGVIFDFGNSQQLAEKVIKLLENKPLRKSIRNNSLQAIVATAWENSAISHAREIEKLSKGNTILQYNIPAINLAHLKTMTTRTGIVQFAKNNQPDMRSGYTLDDNARALIVSCMHYKLQGDAESMAHIHTYFSFIKRCILPSGNFLNYLDTEFRFTEQNYTTNLEDSAGRALWSLGYLISMKDVLPEEMIAEACLLLKQALVRTEMIHSTRAMAFAVKGLCLYYTIFSEPYVLDLIKTLADRLERMYEHESETNWNWFEASLTYANSLLPEAMLYAWQVTNDPVYRKIAINSLDFLISKTFNKKGIAVISNRGWLVKGEKPNRFGEQPIDVAYAVMTLSAFYEVFKNDAYRHKMNIAFNWFQGQNYLHQIVYNPATGGCYDGLEDKNVNLNQGAESTVSYLMARLTMEQYVTSENSANKASMVF
ncbi:MAG: glycosyltransferase [Bacteroidetes bacterium]|nr:MAG: glycosyltransferase [Bacteroidota bacterium]